MADKVPDEERDEVIQRLLKEPDNKACFDCGSKNPKWCSANIAIFLCFQCSGTHRSYGVHISFVRSLKMDKWKKTELKQMELGGNKLAKEYYNKNGMMVDGKPDHKNPALGKYKTGIKNQAAKECGVELPKEVVPGVKKVEQKQEQIKANEQQNQDPLANIVPEEQPKEVIVKKAKKMIEADIFDFSDIKPVTKLALPENNAKPLEVVKKISETSGNLASKSVKLPSQDNQYNLGGLFQGNSNNNMTKGKSNLAAKKVDNINFDADDFFSQFDAVPEKKTYEKISKVEEKKEVENEEKKEEEDQKKNKGFAMSEPAPREEEVVVDDASKRYEELVDSEAKEPASGNMMFGKESENLYGRNSQPEQVSYSQRLSDQYQAARLTAGSNGIQEYKDSANATAGVVMEKGTYIANGAYTKAGQAKNAALDWFSSMTATTNGNSN